MKISKRKIFALLITLGLLVVVFYKIDWGELLNTFKDFNFKNIWLIVPLYVLTLYLRGVRWKALLLNNAKYSSLHLGEVFTVGSMLNIFLPARAGDVYRAYYLGSVIPADPLNVGDKVYVSISYDSNGGIESTYIEYINNERFLVAMIILYSGAIVLIGGMKGVRALVGLIITVLAVFFIMVPLIYDGYDSILVTVLTSIGIIAITFIIVSGFTKQTLAASLGTAGGIIVAGIFAIVFGNLMKLTGACEDSLQLSMIEGGSRFNFENIMISGIIVGALGACMDVGMSIASALHELSVEGNGMTIKKLIRSGMNIGKDVMGTMTNTLILAYVGSSLTVILMLKGYGFEAYQIANNTQLVLEEVVRAIAGSFGLVITIPITTLVSSVLMGKRESDLIGK